MGRDSGNAGGVVASARGLGCRGDKVPVFVDCCRSGLGMNCKLALRAWPLPGFGLLMEGDLRSPGLSLPRDRMDSDLP